MRSEATKSCAHLNLFWERLRDKSGDMVSKKGELGVAKFTFIEV